MCNNVASVGQQSTCFFVQAGCDCRPEFCVFGPTSARLPQTISESWAASAHRNTLQTCTRVAFARNRADVGRLWAVLPAESRPASDQIPPKSLVVGLTSVEGVPSLPRFGPTSARLPQVISESVGQHRPIITHGGHVCLRHLRCSPDCARAGRPQEAQAPRPSPAPVSRPKGGAAWASGSLGRARPSASAPMCWRSWRTPSMSPGCR